MLSIGPTACGICKPGTSLAPATHMSRIVRCAALIPAFAAIFAIHVSVVTAQEPEADLSVSADAFSSTSGVTVALDYFNQGPSDAPGTVIVLDVPDGSRLVEGPGCTQAADGQVTCQVGTVRVLSPNRLDVRFMPADPGPFTVSAVISSTVADPNPGDNTDGATVTVENQADLSVSLSGGTGTIGEGDVFNLFVQFENAGPLPASDVTILVALPEGLEYAGGSCAATSSGDIRCAYAEMPAMTVGVEIVNVRAVDAGSHTIAAMISSSTPDPDPADNSDSIDVTVEPREADLSTTVTDLADPVKPGRTVTYVVEITNGGPSAATNVTAEVGWTTTSAGKIDLIGLSASGASCVVTAQQRVVCQAASLAAGDSVVIELQLRPRGQGELSVTAAASAAELDPNGSNNTDTETTRIGAL